MCFLCSSPHLDVLWKAFGPEWLIYGSNWPVCDRVGFSAEVYGDQLALLREYFAQKGRDAVEGFFWRNALAAYRYDTRTASTASVR
eukprot:SAG22_NODE_97_length_20760_cov_43.302850_2_plen_86_part_00